MADQQYDRDDPWAVADNAKPADFEYFGQVKADVWFGFFPGGGGKPVPYDPAIHPVDKRSTMIEIQIIPVPEQTVTFDIHQSLTSFSPDWTKVTLPSIKALGLDGIRSLNNRWVRVAMADGKREKKDKETGAKTGEYFKTFKFLAVYNDQAECQAAYSGAAPTSTEPQPAADAAPDDAEKQTALKFARVLVENNAKGESDLTVVINKVTTAVAGMPMISKYFTGNSPEILNLISEAMTK